MSTLGIRVHKARSPSFKPPRPSNAAPRLRLLAATHNARGKKTAYDLSPELTTPYAILDVTSQTPTTCRDRAFSPLLGQHWAEAGWQSCKVYDGVDRAKDAAWWAAVVAAREQPKCPRRSALVTAYKKRNGKYPRELKYFDSATGCWIHNKPEARAKIYTRVYREQVLQSEAGQARLADWRAVIAEHKALGSDFTIVVKDKDGPRCAENNAESWCEYTPAVHAEKRNNEQHSFGHGYLVLEAVREIGAAEGMCVDGA